MFCGKFCVSVICSSYKPLLRDSVKYENGTYVDAVFNKVDMTPLIDDLEYNQDLDCKLRLEPNVTFEVTGMNPEVQMCMYEMQEAPVDMFTFIRELVSYSITLDVVWTTDDTIMVTNEEIGLLSNFLPATYLNMTRIGSSDCTPLKYWVLSMCPFKLCLFQKRAIFKPFLFDGWTGRHASQACETELFPSSSRFCRRWR